MTDATASKTCTKCGETKRLTEYHVSRDNRDGRRGACKACSIRIASEDAIARRVRNANRQVTASEKACANCQAIKPSTNFYRNVLNSDCLSSWCRTCSREAARRSSERIKLATKTAPASKTCTRCGEVKGSNQFYPRPASRDGLTSRCAECCRETRRTWVAEHKEQVAEARKIYDSLHRPEKLERLRRWRAENPEKRAEYAERYALENRERIAEWKRGWYDANRDRLLERIRTDPDVRQSRQEANRAHKERNRERITERQRRRRVDHLGLKVADVDLEALWTGSCGICERPLDKELRWPDPFSKSLDHIIPLSRGGTHEEHNLSWTHLVCNLRKGASVP